MIRSVGANVVQKQKQKQKLWGKCLYIYIPRSVGSILLVLSYKMVILIIGLAGFFFFGVNQSTNHLQMYRCIS